MPGLFDDLPNAPSQSLSFDDLPDLKPSFGNVQSGSSSAPSFGNVQSGVQQAANSPLEITSEDELAAESTANLQAVDKTNNQIAELPGAALTGLEKGSEELGKYAGLATAGAAGLFDDIAGTNTQDAAFEHLVKPFDEAAQYHASQLAKMGTPAQVVGGATAAVPDLALGLASGGETAAVTATEGLTKAILGTVNKGIQMAAPLAEKAAGSAYGEAIASGKDEFDATTDALHAIASTSVMGVLGGAAEGNIIERMAQSGLAAGGTSEAMREIEGRPFSATELGTNVALGAAFGVPGGHGRGRGDIEITPELARSADEVSPAPENRPPSPENVPESDLANSGIKKTESEISTPQAAREADTAQAQSEAWGEKLFGDVQESPSFTKHEQETTSGHALFDDLVPSKTSDQPANPENLDLWEDTVKEVGATPPKEVRSKASVIGELQKDFGDDFGSIEGAINNGKLRIISGDQLPDAVKKMNLPTVPNGWVAKDGSVTIVADKLAPGYVRPLIFHEIGSHVGLQNHPQYPAYVAEVKRLLAAGDSNAQRAVERVKGQLAQRKMSPEVQDRELLAYFVQHTSERMQQGKGVIGKAGDLYGQIKAGVKNYLNDKLGLNLRVTDKDMYYLALGEIKKFGRDNSALQARSAPAFDVPNETTSAAEPEQPKGNVPREDIDAQAKRAIAAGADPEKVAERTKQLYAEHGHDINQGHDNGPAPTSTKNAVRDAERLAEGRDPIVKAAAQSNAETIRRARAAMDANPQHAAEVVNKALDEGVNALTATEEASLLLHKVGLRNERDAAMKIVLDPAASEHAKQAAQVRYGEAEAQIARLDEATEASGREWGRMGQFRQQMMRADYSLESMQRRARVAKGSALTPEELARVKSESETYEKAKVEADKAQAAVDADHAGAVKQTYQSLVKEMVGQLKAARKDGTFIKKLKSNADESRDWIKKNFGPSKASAGVDPTVFYHLARIGAYHIANGAVKFKDWVLKMKAEFGDNFSKVEKSLPAVFEAAKAQHDLGATGVKPRMRAKKEIDPENITHKDVYDLARAHIINGVHGEDAVMKAVHGDLAQYGLSERDVRRLFSEYGEAKFPSKAADKTELREIRALVQMQESIDRINEGLPALKSGVQRDKATQLVREKRRQLNDLLKAQEAKNGMSPEKLVTYQEMRKRNLENQIEDLTKELATGEKKVRQPTPPDSTEVTALKAERDKLRKAIDERAKANQQPAPSDPAHERAWASLQKQLGELERRIKERDIATKAKTPPVTSIRIEEYKQRRAALKQELENMKPSPPPTFPKDIHAERNKLRRAVIEKQIRLLDNQIATGEKPVKLKSSPDDTETIALKKQRDALKAQIKAAELAKNPPLSPEEKYQQQRGKSLQRQLEDIYKRIENNDYEKRTRPDRDLSAANQKAQYKLYQAKNLFLRHQFELSLKNRTPLAKIFGGIGQGLNLARAVMTSFDLSATLRQGGFIALGHPIRALKALATSISAARGEEYAFRAQREIEQRPNFFQYKKAGLHLGLGPGHELNNTEEQFMSRWIEGSVPGSFKRLKQSPSIKNAAKLLKDIPLAPVRGSERAFKAFLNKLRADSFDAMVGGLAKNGKEPTKEEAKAVANYINIATGRGHIGSNKKVITGLNGVFFAPRLVASRFNLLAGQPMYGGTARTRAMVAGEYARFLMGVGAVYAIGAAAHAAFYKDDNKHPFIETDPRSANFGKMQFGPSTFIDPLAGLSQVTTFVGREVTGQTKTNKGQINPLRQGYKPLDPNNDKGPTGLQSSGMDVLARFARTKLAPIPGAIVNFVAGKDLTGQKVTLGSEAQDLTTPMSLQNIANLMKEHGAPAATAFTLADILGMSVQYRTPNKPQQKKDNGH